MISNRYCIPSRGAISSAVEHQSYKLGVTGSIPVSPTICLRSLSFVVVAGVGVIKLKYLKIEAFLGSSVRQSKRLLIVGSQVRILPEEPCLGL